MTSESSEREFDSASRSKSTLGRAALIAEALREVGYPPRTANVVIAELAKQAHERSVIGRVAAQLERAGWRP